LAERAQNTETESLNHAHPAKIETSLVQSPARSGSPAATNQQPD
jgi:hypothetical protein